MENFKVISFPDGQPKLYVLGRNRFTEIRGLEVFTSPALGDADPGRVVLTPVNANGSTSKGCHISLPRDRQTLENIAAALIDAARQLP
jgi:hypothetical protein